MDPSRSPDKDLHPEGYLLAAAVTAITTMLFLVVGPFGAWSSPYEEIRTSSPAMRLAVVAPLLPSGLAALSSSWLARRAPSNRSRWQLAVNLALHLVSAGLVIASAAVFLVVFSDFNFERVWLHWGFYGSAVSASVASLLAWRAMTRSRSGRLPSLAVSIPPSTTPPEA